MSQFVEVGEDTMSRLMTLATGYGLSLDQVVTRLLDADPHVHAPRQHRCPTCVRALRVVEHADRADGQGVLVELPTAQ